MFAKKKIQESFSLLHYVAKSRGNVYKKHSYKPRVFETDNNAFKLSFTYPFFALSDFHRPWRLNNMSGTPALAATVAPPERKLCKPKRFLSNPIFSSSVSKIFLILEYDNGLLDFRRYCDFFVFVTARNIYSSSSCMLAVSKYNFKLETGQNLLSDLLINFQLPSRYISVLLFSINSFR